MRIEEITKESLIKESKSQLAILRERIDQLWKANFHANNNESSGTLGRRDLIRKYKLLVSELTTRRIFNKKLNAIESYIFDKSNFHFSVSEFDEIVVIPDFLSISGSFVRNPEESENVDIVLRDDEKKRYEAVMQLGQALQKKIKKEVELNFQETSPHSSFISLFDLVLRPKQIMEITRVRETEILKSKKIEEKKKKEREYTEETERIRMNAKQAKFPHEFMAAQFTHKNGHPRCLICGDEETHDKICRKEDKKVHKDDKGKGSEFGNIDFKVGDKGSAIMQIHIMGLEEDEVAALKKTEKAIMIARQDPLKLRTVLMDAIGQHGAHIDIRMKREGDKFWEGGEIMIGNLSGLEKLKKLKTQGKLRFAWKQSQAGEKKKKVIRGTSEWMLIGERSVHVFSPGESGASENKHAAMIQIEKLHWEIYVADDHAKKIRFKNRYLTGNFLFSFAPVSAEGEKEKRVWMLSRLKEADYEETIRKRLPDTVSIFKVKEEEQIVGGIVYEPKKEDSQGDYSTEEEIRQACYYYMEHARKFKLQHEGAPISSKINILENYIAPQNLDIAGEKVSKGSWILIIRIRDAALWDLVKKEKVTGFSMAGIAQRKETKSIK